MKQSLFGVCFALLFSLFSAHASEDYWRDTLWIRKIPLGGNTYAKIMFHPDGKSVFVASDHYLFRYDVLSGEILRTYEMKNGGYIRDYAITKNNKIILACDQSFDNIYYSTIEIWDLDIGFLREYKYDSIPFFNRSTGTTIGLAPDDTLIYIGRGDDYGIHVVRLFDGKEIHVEKGYSWLMSISDDGRYLATNKINQNYGVLLDTRTWKQVSTFPLMHLPKFDKTGRYICGAGANNIVYLYDRETNISYPLVSHKEALHDVCFTNDGKYIVSAGYGDSDTPDKGGYRIWSVETKEKIYEAPYYTGTSGFIALSPDNRIYGRFNGNFELTMWKFRNPIIGDVHGSSEENSIIFITPNPSHSSIEVQLPLLTQSCICTIYDIHGQSVLQKTFPTGQTEYGKVMIDVTSLVNGSYTCTITIDRATYSSSFIINR
ncbi:MAG: T9SS type A sorting domain-containing protein [Candidatus Kapaibacterium sp.]|jgi:WD40 repeat protein